MDLVWKLLRQHISIGQFVGFFFANLFGMLIVLLGIQFYHDVVPVFTAEDSFMSSDYVIVSKKIGMGTTLSGRSHDFSPAEVENLGSQPFVRHIGAFTSARYKVEATMGINGKSILNTELPIESVPDEFIDVPLSNWNYTEGDQTIPIILPRSYINMYNFGFAQNHQLPRISDGLMGMIDFHLYIKGNEFKGRVIAFSNRLNSILVPQKFMAWSNIQFAPDEQSTPTRLLVDMENPTDKAVVRYMEKNGYEVEDDKLQAEKTTYFLRLIVTMVMMVGLVISILSFYILMLSIYLLVQKNADKLENLLLIGYSPSRVARPYQWLTIGLNVLVLVIALVILFFLRRYYMEIINALFPQTSTSGLLPAIVTGGTLFLLVSILNIFAIRRKVMSIWKRKD
ncbi:MAG: ABC transporter permease [Prevotella sp.]|nr:ABC transporter permease [Prevotella sp.]